MDHPHRTLQAIAVAPLDSLDGRRLVLVLHGYGADERDLLPVAQAVAGGDGIMSIRGPVPVGAGAGWADGPRDAILRGDGIGAAAADVLAFLDDLPARGLGTPASVRLLGFSQGGAVALSMLRRAPDRFDRIVVLSGFVAAEEEAGDALLLDRRIPVFWGRGDADPVIPADAVARTASWLLAHTDSTIRFYPGLGHGVAEEEIADIRAFLAG